MTRSLSGRLLIGVISLVVLGLLISDVATFALLKSSLVSRIDGQLRAPSTRVAAVLFLGGTPQDRGPGGVQVTSFPSGTIAEVVAPDGSVLVRRPFDFTSESEASPVLPEVLPGAGSDRPTILTVAGTEGISQFEIAVWSEDSFRGNFVVLAVPLTEVQTTLGQLALLEAVITVGLVMATAAVAFLIIRIGLRPLVRMGAVAQDIAAGDLSRRVEPATPDTEIGRLGLALNGMLTQIESAFAERTRSEGRLRRFIADASHELRTPLTSIRGYAEMLRRGAEKSPEDSAVARRRIEEESVRMSEMVDDMLVLARLGQGRPLETASVDLRSIARDAAADAHAVAPQREISLHAPDPVVVKGDDTRIRQALGNLVRNALVHTPAESPIEIGVSADDGLARMFVADHGPGLRAEEASRIFEPFYRADPSRSRDSGGVGLGLSIVSAVAGAHGGHVRVSDTPGGGATFEIDLPIASSRDSSTDGDSAIGP